MNLTSDALEYYQEEATFLAEGNVFLTQGPMQLRANRLWVNNNSKQLKGSGDVAFIENGNTLFASEIEYDLATEKGVLLDGRLFLEEDNYTLTGKRIERLGFGQITLHEAFFTACDCPEDPDWHIKAKRIQLTLGTYLTTKDLFFYVGKTPILYLPYFIYPVKTTRQTGLLIPNVGGSSTQGLRYNQDFFWAFSQSQDATISLDYRGKKGVGGGVEYRYVFSENTHGTLQAKRFHDIEKDSDRTALHYQHQQQFSDRMKFKLTARYVTEDYYTELSDFTSERALQKIESNTAITYRGDESFGYILARYTQDLSNTNSTTTLQTLPEVGWNLIGHKAGPFYFDFSTTYTRFFRNTDFEWERGHIAPRLSLPLRVFPAITATPWAEYRGVQYSDLLRNITGTGIDLTSKWGKLTYEEINTDNPPNVLQADAIDTIHDRRSVTLSLTPLTSIRFTQTYNVDAKTPSDLRTEWSLRPSPSFSFYTDVFYHWQSQNVTAVNTDLRFSVKDKLKVSIGQRYTQGGLLPQKGDSFNPYYLGDNQTVPQVSFITGRLKAILSSRITFATEALYNAHADQFPEIHYGLLYERQCWLIALAYQDLLTRNEFLFTVSLKGLGENLPKKFSYLFDF